LLLLYVAKELSKNSYGMFIYVTMILGYLPLLHFGSLNGFAIEYPKIIERDKNAATAFFHNYSFFSIAIQIFIACIIFFFTIQVSKFTVFIIVLNFIIAKYIDNVRIHLASHLEFYKVNLLKLFVEVTTPVFTFVTFWYLKNIDSLLISPFLVNVCLLCLIVYYFNIKLTFPDAKIWQDIQRIYKVGIFIYFVWAIDLIFQGIDRVLISQFYPMYKLAEYGFASNCAMGIYLLALSFIAPYSQLLFKSIAQKDWHNVSALINTTNNKMHILIFFTALAGIIFYPLVIMNFLIKYQNTYVLFIVLIFSSTLLSVNSMQIYYMTSTYQTKALIKLQIIVLLINITLNIINISLRFDIIYIALTTVITLLIYYYLLNHYVTEDLKRRMV
jgi:O-antigen/teichoic acid export membrane protein